MFLKKITREVCEQRLWAGDTPPEGGDWKPVGAYGSVKYNGDPGPHEPGSWKPRGVLVWTRERERDATEEEFEAVKAGPNVQAYLAAIASSLETGETVHSLIERFAFLSEEEVAVVREITIRDHFSRRSFETEIVDSSTHG